MGRAGRGRYMLEYRRRGDSSARARITQGDFAHLPSTSGNRLLVGVATGLECHTTHDFRIGLHRCGAILLDAFGPYNETSHRAGDCPRNDRPTWQLVFIAPAHLRFRLPSSRWLVPEVNPCPAAAPGS